MAPDSTSSPLETLRQLRAMLDAGTLTQAEFEALKQQLVFGPVAAVPAPPLAAAPAAAPAPPLAEVPVAPAGFAAAETAATAATRPETVAEAAAETVGQAVAGLPPVAPAPPEPPAAPAVAPAATPTAFVVDTYEAAAAPPPTNYLSLVLSIGGLLLLFGLVLYLAANRHPSERIDSTSLAAGDSTAVIEVGPQAAPLPRVPVAAPETLRLAPTNPAPAMPRRAASVADTMQRPAPLPVSDTADVGR